MPGPLLPIMAGLGIASIGAQYMGARDNRRFLERQAEREEQLNRRAAIERAMGQFKANPAIRRTPETMTPPDTGSYAAIAGLSNLGMALTPQFAAALRVPDVPDVPDVQIPQTGTMGMGNLGLNQPQNLGLSPMSNYGTNY